MLTPWHYFVFGMFFHCFYKCVLFLDISNPYFPVFIYDLIIIEIDYHNFHAIVQDTLIHM